VYNKWLAKTILLAVLPDEIVTDPKDNTDGSSDAEARPDSAEPGPASGENINARLLFDEASGCLSVEIFLSDKAQELTLESLEELIKANDFQSLALHPEALESVINRIEGEDIGRIEIAQRKDASAEISISEDKMCAFVSTTPACGGATLSEDMMRALMDEKNIDRRCCNETALKRVLDESEVEDVCIAEGKPCQPGKDAQFIALVGESKEIDRVEDEHGKVDFHEVFEFVVIDRDTPLMERKEATPGIEGYDLFGESLPATDGEDVPFDSDHPGALVDPQNDNCLIAEIKGHPIVSDRSVKVEKTLQVDEVNLETGNIDFDGSVLVKGDVHTGMIVKATASIEVKGIVENAILEAGSDIIVNSGVLGSEPSEEEGGHAHGHSEEEETQRSDESEQEERLRKTLKCHLRAGGTIDAKFISMADVEAVGDISAKEYILHCFAKTQQHIALGQQGGKGCLIGGRSHADQGFFVNMLGSEANVRTYVFAGTADQYEEQHRQLSEERETHLAQATKLSDSLQKVAESTKNKQPDPQFQAKIDKVRSALEAIKARIGTLDRDIGLLEEEIKEANKVKVQVKKKVYPNVFLSINGRDRRCKFETAGGQYVREGKEIVKN
jgi:uncharacterized protein